MNIELEIADFNEITSYEGQIKGVVFKTSIEEMKKNLDNKIKQKDLNFKGALVYIQNNPNVSLLIINEFMEYLFSKIEKSNPDLIFNTVSDNTLGKDELFVKIILTGL